MLPVAISNILMCFHTETYFWKI